MADKSRVDLLIIIIIIIIIIVITIIIIVVVIIIIIIILQQIEMISFREVTFKQRSRFAFYVIRDGGKVTLLFSTKVS